MASRIYIVACTYMCQVQMCRSTFFYQVLCGLYIMIMDKSMTDTFLLCCIFILFIMIAIILRLRIHRSSQLFYRVTVTNHRTEFHFFLTKTLNHSVK